jgi:anthranilate synthase/aminodeoxychorismate synthase-like glutamine amidotransferase
MILVLDNYDSFTYNLVQYLGELGAEPVVRRNDEITVEDVAALAPDAIVISPGPGQPRDAGISLDLIRRLARRQPVLGVCLGHQAIGEAFGGRIVPADRLMHGKTSPIAHTGAGVLAGLPDPFEAMRYHSLVIEPESLPPDLEVTAWSADRPRGAEIMGVRHRQAPVFGVQFHPESVGTAVGMRILKNFLTILRDTPPAP